MSVRDRLRRWLGVPEPVAPKGDGDLARALHSLSRQLGELRGVMYHQTDYTVEALRRAGWQTDEEVAQHEALQRALRVLGSQGDVIAGPWTGEVGFELMYWIPFLNWLVDQGLDPNRLIVMSRGGAAPWYRHFTSRYIDILDVVSADEFRDRTAGKKKQYDIRRDFDRELVDKAKAQFAVPNATSVHPSAMFRLFTGLWRRRATVKLVESFTSFRPLAPLPAASLEDAPNGLPSGYVAAKFYFSKAFPDTQSNRNFITELLRNVSRQVPVALLSTSVRLDEHSDFQTTGHSGLFVIDPHTMPHKNLELQSRIICGSRGFIGTYGGFSYLAPFYGVRSVSFFSKRYGFEPHHLELADRVFDKLLPGGFVALHRCAIDLLEPAVASWVTGSRSVPSADDAADVEPEPERVTM
jgi:hypothetical protein